MPAYAIVEAPSVLGLRPTGVEDLPKALLEAGLAERVSARRAARVDPPPYDPKRDPDTGLLNPRAIRDYSIKLADATGSVLDQGEFPVVLGGDCSILLGNLLALRRRGHYGLLFVDGHADFYQPEANINGEAASSELALATGRGPEVLTRLDGYRPLLRDQDVVAFAQRDAEEAASYHSQPLPRTLRSIDLGEVRRLGADAAARQAVTHLDREELAGFWIHLDADVLDDAIMRLWTTECRTVSHGRSWRRCSAWRWQAVARWASRSRSTIRAEIRMERRVVDWCGPSRTR